MGTHTPHDSCKTDLRTLSRTVADRILDLIEPSANLNSVRLFKGGFTNFTHLIEATSRQGQIVRLVVHRYGDLYRDSSSKANVEYHALRLLIANDIPVPVPLYLDETGMILGGAWDRCVLRGGHPGGISTIPKKLGHAVGSWLKLWRRCIR